MVISFIHLRMIYEAESAIRFVPKLQIPTDGLILKGGYVSITVAVIAETVKEETSPTAPQHPRKATADGTSEI